MEFNEEISSSTMEINTDSNECSSINGDNRISMTTIEELPEEVLQYILSLVSPYQDLQSCKLVSKKWRQCVLKVIRCKKWDLYKAIRDFDVRWERRIHCGPNAIHEKGSPRFVSVCSVVTPRYSHAATVHEDAMYVFGGCTSHTTTFNDLWRLDLNSREWSRPRTNGNFPTPKASSSFVTYKNLLILFGGWRYPPAYPIYQSYGIFDELHTYNVIDGQWKRIDTLYGPPPTAGHSVSIIGNTMIVFGGLKKLEPDIHCEKSNDVWLLDLETWMWHQKDVQPAISGGLKPSVRFGQSQIVLDDENILILGGSAGCTKYFSDAWILHMPRNGSPWRWLPVDLVDQCNGPVNIWNNPACKIGDKIVLLSRIRKQSECNGANYIFYPKSTWNMNINGAEGGGEGRRRHLATEDGRNARIDLANRQQDIDENVNGTRGVLRRRESAPEQPSLNRRPMRVAGPNRTFFGNMVPNQRNVMVAFDVPASFPAQYPPYNHNSISGSNEGRQSPNNKNRPPRPESTTHRLGIYVLDIKDTLKNLDITCVKKPSAVWLPPKHDSKGPDEAILYTLVAGKSELIMFGGVERESNPVGLMVDIDSQISNNVHFLKAPNYVV